MAVTREGAAVSSRMDALREIAANRNKQVVDQIEEGGGNADLDESRVQDEVEEQPNTLTTTEEQTGEVTITEAAAPPEPPKVKIKVDGQEQEVDQDAVMKAGIAALQKESAADKRLEEAARLRKDLEAQAQQFAELQSRAQQQNQPTQPSSDAAPLNEDEYAQLARKIQYGSEAEARDVIKTMFERAAGAKQSDQLTLQQVSDFLEFREATRWAGDEFKDLLADPVLRTAFSTREREIRSAGDARPYRDVYAQIGGELRDWLKSKTPAAPAASAASSTETRAARKAHIVTIPTAAGRQPAPETPKEPTPSEVIEQMRRARQRR